MSEEAPEALLDRCPDSTSTRRSWMGSATRARPCWDRDRRRCGRHDVLALVVFADDEVAVHTGLAGDAWLNVVRPPRRCSHDELYRTMAYLELDPARHPGPGAVDLDHETDTIGDLFVTRTPVQARSIARSQRSRLLYRGHGRDRPRPASRRRPVCAGVLEQVGEASVRSPGQASTRDRLGFVGLIAGVLQQPDRSVPFRSVPF